MLPTICFFTNIWEKDPVILVSNNNKNVNRDIGRLQNQRSRISSLFLLLIFFSPPQIEPLINFHIRAIQFTWDPHDEFATEKQDHSCYYTKWLCFNTFDPLLHMDIPYIGARKRETNDYTFRYNVPFEFVHELGSRLRHDTSSQYMYMHRHKIVCAMWNTYYPLSLMEFPLTGSLTKLALVAYSFCCLFSVLFSYSFFSFFFFILHCGSLSYWNCDFLCAMKLFTWTICASHQ